MCCFMWNQYVSLNVIQEMGAIDKIGMIKGFVKCARKSTMWNMVKILFYPIDTAVLNTNIVKHCLGERMEHDIH